MDDTSFHLGDYFKPKSVTWWAGVGSLIVGGVLYFGGGDADTALQMLATGAGLVGIRAKLGRR